MYRILQFFAHPVVSEPNLNFENRICNVKAPADDGKFNETQTSPRRAMFL